MRLTTARLAGPFIPRAHRRIYFAGSVGINGAPQVKLDVNGTIATDVTGTEDEFHITRQVNGGDLAAGRRFPAWHL